MSAITPKSVPVSEQRQDGADAGRRQRREDRHRVDVALVEHAEDDVDGDERREDEQRLVRERRAERLRGSLEAAVDAVRAAGASRIVSSTTSTAAPSDVPGAASKESVDGGELPLVADDERRQRLVARVTAESGTRPPSGPAR